MTKTIKKFLLCYFQRKAVVITSNSAIGCNRRNAAVRVDIAGRCCLRDDPLTSLPFLPAKNDYRAVREGLHAGSERVLRWGFRRDQLHLPAGSHLASRGIPCTRTRATSPSWYRAPSHRTSSVLRLRQLCDRLVWSFTRRHTSRVHSAPFPQRSQPIIYPPVSRQCEREGKLLHVVFPLPLLSSFSHLALLFLSSSLSIIIYP